MSFKYWLHYSFYAVFIFICSLSTVASGQRAATAQINFGFAPTFITGADTWDTAVVDLDGDGNLDVIAGNNRYSTILTIIYGTGQSGFENPVIVPLYGTFASTLDVEDLNNDGRPDIVFAEGIRNRIGTIMNLGSRQFSIPVITNPPDAPNGLGEFGSVEIGDFNGDGVKDVVAIQGQSNKRLRFFHVTPQGGLTAFATLNLYGNAGGSEGTMFVGDINGDNLTDVAVASGDYYVHRNISFVYGRTDGALAFTFGFNVENEAYAIEIRDLDNDSDNDLAVAFYDRFGAIQHSLQAFGNNGNGTFTPAAPLLQNNSYGPYDLTVADFDGDGKLDLAAILEGECLTVARGRGDLTFEEGEDYLIFTSSSIYAGDFNHDNRTDILTASNFTSDINRVAIVLNQNFGTFRAPRTLRTGPNHLDAADFNLDGRVDFVSGWTSDYPGATVQVSLSDPATGDVFRLENDYPTATALTALKKGDFNGDGKIDFVSSHNANTRRLGVYLGDGSGTFSAPIYTPHIWGIETILVADFNADGRDDVFLVDFWGRSYVMLSVGDGTFVVAPGSPFDTGNSTLTYQAGDFDGDNRTDIISEAGIFLGDGMGRFTRSPLTLPILRKPVVADFNRDGNLDIGGAHNGFYHGIFGNGQGGVLGTFSVPLSGDELSIASSVTADFDLDGYPDVALEMESGDLNGEKQTGNLVFICSGGSTPSWKPVVRYHVGNTISKLLAGDFNADGKPDLGYVGRTRGVFFNLTVRSGTTKFDFDGDGKTDIGIFRPSDGSWWYSRSSDNAFRVFGFGTLTDVITPGDFTGDGKADIAVFRPSTGEWFVQRSEDGSFFSFPFGTAGDVPVPADYDGDGKTDAAVFRPNGATWFILNSNGSGTSILTFGSPEDKAVPADFDGDGKADIAIFRPSDGSWWYLRSSDGTFRVFRFGIGTDKPVQGDYSGDGKADLAIFRESTGEWFFQRSEDNSYYSVPFGAAGDLATPGDYDGDGKFDTAVFRPSTANWFVQGSTAGILIASFGANGDRPIPNAFIP